MFVKFKLYKQYATLYLYVRYVVIFNRRYELLLAYVCNVFRRILSVSSYDIHSLLERFKEMNRVDVVWLTVLCIL